MSKLVDKLIEFEKTWENEFEKYNKEAYEIDEKIKIVSGKITSYVSVINTMKREMETDISKIYRFLNGLGQTKPMPDYKSFVPESIPEYTPAPYLPSSNPKNYMNGSEPGFFKKFIDNGIGNGGGKYASGTVKSAYKEEEKKRGSDIMQWEHDKGKREDALKTYELMFEITKIYHDIFSMVRDTVKYTIISELPGIKAFLYAQGVKDAVCSGKLPSQAKPITIQRILTSKPYARHVKFVENTFDFYILFSAYYEHDYLTELIDKKNKSKVDKDYKELHEKSDLLNNLAVFGEQKNG